MTKPELLDDDKKIMLTAGIEQTRTLTTYSIMVLLTGYVVAKLDPTDTWLWVAGAIGTAVSIVTQIVLFIFLERVNKRIMDRFMAMIERDRAEAGR